MKKKTLQCTALLGALMISTTLLGGCSQSTDTTEETLTTQTVSVAEESTETVAETSESTESAETVSSYGQQDGLKYKVVNEQIMITGYIENEEDATIEIPAEIDGKPVVGIGDNAFQASKVAYVTVPDSVTSIGTEAFQGCLHLQMITIPDSVTTIGTDAFKIMTNSNGKYTLISCTEGSYTQTYAAEQGLVYVTEAENSANGNTLLARFTWQGEKADIQIREYQDEAGDSIEWDLIICNKETGAVEQTINMLPEVSGNPHIKTMIKENDVNFDGENELLISKGHFGSSGVLYDTCLEWDANEGTYVENISYGEIPNPEVLASKQLIRAFIDSSNNEYHYYMYAYQDGGYDVVADLTFVGQTDGSVTVTDNRMQEDGSMQAVSEENFTDWNDSLQKWANDGYWDLASNE